MRDYDRAISKPDEAIYHSVFCSSGDLLGCIGKDRSKGNINSNEHDNRLLVW